MLLFFEQYTFHHTLSHLEYLDNSTVLNNDLWYQYLSQSLPLSLVSINTHIFKNIYILSHHLLYFGINWQNSGYFSTFSKTYFWFIIFNNAIQHKISSSLFSFLLYLLQASRHSPSNQGQIWAFYLFVINVGKSIMFGKCKNMHVAYF